MLNLGPFTALIRRLAGIAASTPRPRALYGIAHPVGYIKDKAGRYMETKRGQKLQRMIVRWHYGGKYPPHKVKALAVKHGVGNARSRRFYERMIEAGIPAEVAGKCVKHKYGQGENRGHWTQYLTAHHMEQLAALDAPLI